MLDRVFKISNHRPVPLLQVIAVLEVALGRRGEKTLLLLQAGDEPAAQVDGDALDARADFTPARDTLTGIGRLVDGCRGCYGV